MSFFSNSVFPNTSAAYRALLLHFLDPGLLVTGDVLESAPRGMPIREWLGASFSILQPSSDPITTLDPTRDLVVSAYTAKEFALYDSGTRSVEDFAAAAKFWRGLANEDGTINSAYGYLVWFRPLLPGGKTPWQWCVESIKADPDTRQAVLYFNTPDFAKTGTKDFPCTMSAQFFLRGGRLDLLVYMRSQDLVLGYPYDIAWFCSLMDRMVADLAKAGIPAVKGVYHHRVGSLHLYMKNQELARKMVGQAAG